MAEDSDEIKELVERAKNLDPDAFGRIYDMYYDNIYRYAYYKTGSAHDAEDMASQVFTGALKSIANFTWSGSTFASWLFRIAHNVVVDYWRKRGQAATEPIEDHTGLAHSSDTAATVIATLRYDKLRSALALLPDDQSKVIALRFISGLSAKETAQIMGKTVGAIKAQQFRAVDKLKELMAGEFDD